MRLLCYKNSLASDTSGSHIVLAEISTVSRVEMLRGRKEGGGIKYDNLTVTDYFHHLPNNDINYVTGAGPGESHTDLT